MQLTDADLVHGQVPGLSALVTHTHTLRCPFTQDLSVAAILACGGMCVCVCVCEGVGYGGRHADE